MALEGDLHKLASLTELPVGAVEAASALGVAVGEVLDAGRGLTDSGTLREEGSGWVAVETAELSGPERAVLAGQLAAAVDTSDPGRKGRLLAIAGSTAEALPLLIEAGSSGDPKAAEAALEIGPEDPTDAGRLHLALAAHHRSRGETPVAIDHARRSLPLLEGIATIDALGFLSQLHDDLQQPQASSTWANLAAGAALNAGDKAKAGSILTLAGRAMSRLGLAEEAANASDDGLALVEAHGSPTQKARARSNRAWVFLDHGDASEAALAFDSISDLAEYLGGEFDQASRFASQSRALFHACQSETAVGYYEEAIRLAGDAPAPNFLAHLGFAEGATLHRVGEPAVDAAEKAVAVTESDMQAWRNVAYFTLARAERSNGRHEAAAEHLERAIELTPEGIDGLRLRLRCEVERLAQLDKKAKWPKDEAATLTDLLLQSRWYAMAVELMTLRAQREKGFDLGSQAVALAARLGSPLLAARAADAAGLWGKPEGAAAAALLREAGDHVAPAWREAWDTMPEVKAGLAVPETLSSEGVDERLDQSLTKAGLTGEVLSPAQRSAQGLEYAGRRTARGWIGPILSWAAALTAIAVVAFLLVPDEPAHEIIATPERLDGTYEARGGPTNEGLSVGGVSAVEGVYWEPVPSLGQGLFAPLPVTKGLVVADALTGTLYGFEQITGRNIWIHDAGGSVEYAPVLSGGVDGGGSPQPRVVWVDGEDLAARPALGGNSTDSWRVPLDGPVLGQPLAGPSDDAKSSPIYLSIDAEDGPVFLAIDGNNGDELWRVPIAHPPATDLAATSTGVAFIDTEGTLKVLDPRSQGLESCSQSTFGAVAGQAPVVFGEVIAVPYSTKAIGLYTTQCRLPGYDFGNGTMTQAAIDLDLTHRMAVVDETFVYISEGSLLRYDPAVWDPERHDISKYPLVTPEEKQRAAEIMAEPFVWDGQVSPDEGDRFTTDPVIADDLVLLGTLAGQVIAIDLETGIEVWRYDVGEQLIAEITAVKGALYVTTSEGSLLALGGPGTDGTPGPEPGEFPEGQATEMPESESGDQPEDAASETETTSADTSIEDEEEGPSADEVAGQTGTNSAGRG